MYTNSTYCYVSERCTLPVLIWAESFVARNPTRTCACTSVASRGFSFEVCSFALSRSPLWLHALVLTLKKVIIATWCNLGGLIFPILGRGRGAQDFPEVILFHLPGSD